MSKPVKGRGMGMGWLGNFKPKKLSFAEEAPGRLKDKIVPPEAVETLSDKIVGSLSESEIPEDEIREKGTYDPFSLSQEEGKSAQAPAPETESVCVLLPTASAAASNAADKPLMKAVTAPEFKPRNLEQSYHIDAVDKRLVKAVNATEFKPRNSVFTVTSECLTLPSIVNSNSDFGCPNIAVDAFNQDVDKLRKDPQQFRDRGGDNRLAVNAPEFKPSMSLFTVARDRMNFPPIVDVDSGTDHADILTGKMFDQVVDGLSEMPEQFCNNAEDERLVKAVNAPEFKPRGSIFTVTGEDMSSSLFLEPDSEIGYPDIIAVEMLKQEICALAQDPEQFSQIAEYLVSNLPSFVTRKETLEEIVNSIIVKALSESNFRYSAAKLAQHLHETKCLEMQDGISFRNCFFTRCQQEYGWMLSLIGQLDSVEAKEKVASLAYFFGELLCTMRLSGEIMPVFRNAVISIVDLLMQHATSELIVCLTRLLKLVGPTLEADCPKHAEDMFERIRAFCVSAEGTTGISSSILQALLAVCKLYTRDRDQGRPLVTSRDQVSGVAESTEGDGFDMSNLAAKLCESSIFGKDDSPDSPVDWSEYYVGDDAELSPEFYYQDVPGASWHGAEASDMFANTYPHSAWGYSVGDDELEDYVAFLNDIEQY